METITLSIRIVCETLQSSQQKKLVNKISISAPIHIITETDKNMDTVLTKDATTTTSQKIHKEDLCEISRSFLPEEHGNGESISTPFHKTNEADQDTSVTIMEEANPNSQNIRKDQPVRKVKIIRRGRRTLKMEIWNPKTNTFKRVIIKNLAHNTK